MKTRRPKYLHSRHAPPPPAPRFPLSSLLFDLILDGVDLTEAERQIRAAASTPVEVAEALRRFKVSVGSGKAVTS